MTLKSLLIKLVFSTALISGAAFADGRSIELSQIDKLLPNLPKNPSSISELADSVKKASDMDLVRARLIYKWIITNIQYDYATLVSYEIGAKGVLESTSWDQLAARILREKKGVCGDMSFLYWVAAKDAGLECESILGWFSMQDGELPNDAWQRGVPNHRWNAVKIDGSWRLLDCAAQEFLDPPDQMIRTHYPLVPYWQLMDYRRPAKTPTAPPLDYPGAASSGVRFITPVNCLNFTNRGPFEFELANPSGTPLSVAVSKGWETETVPAKAENKDGKTYVTVDFTGHDEKDYYTASVFTDKEPLYCFFIVLDSALGKDPCFWVSVSPGSVAEAQGAIATSTLKIQSFNKFEIRNGNKRFRFATRSDGDALDQPGDARRRRESDFNPGLHFFRFCSKRYNKCDRHRNIRINGSNRYSSPDSDLEHHGAVRTRHRSHKRRCRFLWGCALWPWRIPGRREGTALLWSCGKIVILWSCRFRKQSLLQLYRHSCAGHSRPCVERRPSQFCLGRANRLLHWFRGWYLPLRR